MRKSSHWQNAGWTQRGDWKERGRRVLTSAAQAPRGFTLIELMITVTVLAILTMGVMPLVKLAVRRQKEQELHEALRQIRTAIDDFHRDTMGMNCSGVATGQQPVAGGSQPGQNVLVDPRSKVVISDCTIFGVDNPDHYPPTLELLTDGVNVIPRAGSGQGGRGLQSTGTSSSNSSSVLDSQLSTKKKVYLREVPIDPITGQKDWDMKSCYDAVDSTSWGGENVFDVRSKSKAKALNGEQYSDW
jgi:general secretion pathway protein G